MPTQDTTTAGARTHTIKEIALEKAAEQDAAIAEQDRSQKEKEWNTAREQLKRWLSGWLPNHELTIAFDLHLANRATIDGVTISYQHKYANPVASVVTPCPVEDCDGEIYTPLDTWPNATLASLGYILRGGGCPSKCGACEWREENAPAAESPAPAEPSDTEKLEQIITRIAGRQIASHINAYHDGEQ
jgi:hypothetical protein